MFALTEQGVPAFPTRLSAELAIEQKISFSRFPSGRNLGPYMFARALHVCLRAAYLLVGATATAAVSASSVRTASRAKDQNRAGMGHPSQVQMAALFSSRLAMSIGTHHPPPPCFSAGARPTCQQITNVLLRRTGINGPAVAPLHPFIRSGNPPARARRALPLRPARGESVDRTHSPAFLVPSSQFPYPHPHES